MLTVKRKWCTMLSMWIRWKSQIKLLNEIPQCNFTNEKGRPTTRYGQYQICSICNSEGWYCTQSSNLTENLFNMKKTIFSQKKKKHEENKANKCLFSEEAKHIQTLDYEQKLKANSNFRSVFIRRPCDHHEQNSCKNTFLIKFTWFRASSDIK